MKIGEKELTENNLNVSVDWFEFTVKDCLSPYIVLEKFGLSRESFQVGLSGANGYKSRLRHFNKSISVLYDGTPEMGVHVSVSGSAVAYFLNCYADKCMSAETPFGVSAYEVREFEFSVFADVCNAVLMCGQFTRLDLAIDDIGCNYFTMGELSRIFGEGAYVSRFKSYREDIERSKTLQTGHTIYLGKRKSAMMIRIYDKQAEQRKKGNIVESPWTRWELELHKERANMAAILFADGKGLSDVCIGVLNHYLRLIVKDRSRDSRCSDLPKWTEFINGICSLGICPPHVEKTLNDKREWLIKQVAPTLAALALFDGCVDFIYDLIESGSSRISAQLRSIIQKEAKKPGYDIGECVR